MPRRPTGNHVRGRPKDPNTPPKPEPPPMVTQIKNRPAILTLHHGNELVNKSIKNSIIAAFNRLGGEEWLVRLANNDPRTFAALLSKLLDKEPAVVNDLVPIKPNICVEFTKPDVDGEVVGEVIDER